MSRGGRAVRALAALALPWAAGACNLWPGGLDDGLAILADHAKQLGYDAVVLFLDELILWLATYIGDTRFLQREGQKISKLVESTRADRAIPIVSFIARQRDLREFIGEQIPGAEQQSFGDVLNWWEGRFHRISLEDRNLPEIAKRRLLRTRSQNAEAQLEAAFTETRQLRREVLQALLGSGADEAMFRQVYPFSPALVQTLVAVSSVLQRERTALKIMAMLLSEQRDQLRLGEIVPVGDLWDVLASGDEPFSQDMRLHFENAKRLWDQKLLPMLEREHGMRLKAVDGLSGKEPVVRAFRGDGRILKTLLLASLAPEVEALKHLTVGRLVALNWGSIRSPIPHREAAQLLRKLQAWGSQVGEIELIGDAANPEIALRISSVDVDQILSKAQIHDSFGNRKKKIRELLFDQLEIARRDELPPLLREVPWRGTQRTVEVIYDNVRELPDESLRAGDAALRVVLDFPFDEAGHGPREDLTRVETFREREPDTSTVVWLPAHFGAELERDLGKLVIIDSVLVGERFDDYADHLSAVDRQAARTLLQNQRSQLEGRLMRELERAFGLDTTTGAVGEGALPVEDRVQSLSAGIVVQRPVGANLHDAFEHLVRQALSARWPGHPDFGERVRPVDLKRVWEQLQHSVATEDGRALVPKEPRGLREAMKNLAEQLRLGTMHEDAFVLGEHWKKHFDRRIAQAGGSVTVGQLREWIDEPQPMGLERPFADLVVMTFAAQTNRRLLLHGGPCRPELGKLTDEMELREQALPDATRWPVAVERAGRIFGAEASPLLNAANVAELEESLSRELAGARDRCRKLWSTLDERLRAWGLDPAEANRVRTARAVSALVDQLKDAAAEDAVGLLAEADVPTTPEAMGRSFRTAVQALDALSRTNWSLLEGLEGLPAPLAASAAKVREGLGQALQADELAVPLAAALDRAEKEATALLRKAVPSSAPTSGPTSAPVGSKASPGWRTVQEERIERLSAEAARKQLAALEDQLGAEDRISLWWRIERPDGKGDA